MILILVFISFIYYWKKDYFILTLYLYHAIFLFLFDYWAVSKGADILQYEFFTREFIFDLKPGIDFLYTLISFFRIFISLETISIIFNFIGFIAIVLFYETLKKINSGDIYAKLICLTPSLHFFTSTIGKDTLVFFGLMCVIFYLLNNQIYKKTLFNFNMIIFGFLIILMIRPHIFVLSFPFFLFSILIYKIKSKFSLYLLYLLLALSALTLFYINDLLCIFVQPFCDEESFVDILRQVNEFGERLAADNMGSDYRLSIIPYNIFAYLLFPFEAVFNNSMFHKFGVIDSLYNLFFFFLIIKNISSKNYKINSYNNSILLFLSLYVIVFLSIFPNTFSNFGLNLRQKIMIWPYLLIFFIFLKNLILSAKLKSKIIGK